MIPGPQGGNRWPRSMDKPSRSLCLCGPGLLFPRGSCPGVSANRRLDHAFCITVFHRNPHAVPLARSPVVHLDGIADIHSDHIAYFRINHAPIFLSNQFGNLHALGLGHNRPLAVTVGVRHIHTDSEHHSGATADRGNRTPSPNPHQRDCLVWGGGQPLR